MRQVHELKVWPEFFEPLQRGVKTFEVRFNDRHYRVHDVLVLKEWDPSNNKYTGRSLERIVSYVLDNPKFGVQEDHVVMGLRVPRE